MAFSNIVHIFYHLAIISESQWISHSTPSLTYADSYIAAGSYDGSIFLLGGSQYQYHLMQYTISNDAISKAEYGTSKLYISNDASTWGYGQYYVQIDHMLYMVDSSGSRISAYNMASKQYIYSYASITTDVSAYSCLAATSTHLIITGGTGTTGSTLNTVQMYNLQTDSWSSGVPSMNKERSSHSCVVNPSNNALYVIGGMSGEAYLYSIEKIYIDSAYRYWSTLDSTLYYTLRSTRAFIVEESNLIYIIGGGYYQSGSWIVKNMVHTINTNTDSVSYSWSLPYTVKGCAAVMMDNVFYCFGGWNPTTGYLNTFLSYEFPSVSPTSSPSAASTAGRTPSPLSHSVSTTLSTTPLPSTPFVSHTTASSSAEIRTSVTSTLSTDSGVDEDAVCNDIDLEISGFEAAAPWDFRQSTILQSRITNITNSAIHNVVGAAADEKLIIDDDSYYVEFVDASENIIIEQALCAWSQTILNVVSSFIEDEDKAIEIAAIIKYQLIYKFNGNTNMNVSVSLQQDAKVTNEGQKTTTREISSLVITIFIMSAFLAFALVSLVDAKFVRRNDYFIVQNIIGAAFDVCDTVLDLLFAVSLTLYFDETKSTQFLVAMIAAYVFIIIPITYSIIQLVTKSRKWWHDDDDLRGWWTDNGKFLYFLSILTGSSYTAVQLANCNALKLDLFNMGLNKQQRIQFNTKRVYGIVVCENIPQTAIQIWYLTTVGLDLIALLSIIFSFISIVTTTLTICTQKTLMRNQQFAKISFHISGKEIVPSVSAKIKGIKSNIGLLLGINPKLIEIPRAKLAVSHGLKFEIYLFVNNIESKDLNYKRTINEALQNGKLMQIIQEEWNLTVNISNLEFEDIKSRIQQKNSQNSNTKSELMTLKHDPIHPNKNDNFENEGIVQDTTDSD